MDAGSFEIRPVASGTRSRRPRRRSPDQGSSRRSAPRPELYLGDRVNSDWSAAYTPNAGRGRQVSSPSTGPLGPGGRPHIRRRGQGPAVPRPDFGFDAGGLIRGAMNEGKSTPINIRVTGKKPREAGTASRSRQVSRIDGVVDARIIQRLIPRVRHRRGPGQADLGLSQEEVMKNVVAVFNRASSSTEELLDRPDRRHQYFVVQHPEGTSVDRRPLNIRSSARSEKAISGKPGHFRRTTVPTEVTHQNISRRSTCDGRLRSRPGHLRRRGQGHRRSGVQPTEAGPTILN